MTITTFTPVQKLYRGWQIITDSRSPEPSVSTYSGFSNPGGGFVGDLVERNQNPDWRVQVTLGQDASTFYSRQRLKFLRSQNGKSRSHTLPDGFTSDYTISSYSENCDYGAYFEVGGDDSDLQEIARQRLVQRLRQNIRQVELLAPLAECRELYRTIRVITGFTYNTLMSLKDLTRLRTGRARRQAQELWLTWNFGIRPLLSDVQSAGQSIAAFLARQDRSVKLAGKASRSMHGSYDPIFIYDIPAFGLEKVDKIGIYNTKLEYKYVGCFRVRFQSSNDYSLANQVGIDLRSVPSALWELTAFSWIADYFANMSTLMTDTFYQPPTELIYLNFVRKLNSKFTHSYGYGIPSGNSNNVAILDSTPAIHEFEYFTYNRTVLQALPVPAFRVKSFDEIGLHSVSKLLNLLALMRR